MNTISFYSKSCKTLDDFIKKIITYVSSEVNGRRYTVLSKENLLSIFSDNVQIGTFSIANGEKYDTLQERKVTFSTPELQPIISKIMDSLTRGKTTKDFCHKKEIEEIFLEIPIETATEIVGQKEKWLTDFEDLENITKISDETFKKLTLNQLKAVFTGSPDLMIEVIYDQISYPVSAHELFKSTSLDAAVFGKYRFTKVVCESEQLKLTIIDEEEKFQYLPLFFLSLQAQKTNFKSWPLLYLCIAYMESDYHSHTEMNETLFKIIADKEISSQDNIKMIFCCLPGLEHNRKIMLELVKKDGLALQFASPELQKDPTIVVTAVQQNGLALQFASPELRKDLDVASQAILENPNALQYTALDSQESFLISELIEIRNSIFKRWWFIHIRKFIFNNALLHIKKYVEHSKYVQDAVKKSPAIIKRIMAVVGETPSIFQFVPDHPEIAKIAVQQDGLALEFASPELRNDHEIVLTAVQQAGLALQLVRFVLRNDRTIVIPAVQQNGLALRYATPELQNDPTIVKPAVQQNGLALQFATPELRKDPEIVRLAVQQNGLVLYFASPELRKDPTIVLAAVQQNGLVLYFASPELRKDPTIVLAAVQQNGDVLKYASPELRKDPTIVLPAVQQDGRALQYASPELRKDPTIVLPAVQQNGRALQYASPELRNDPTIVLPAVQQNGRALKYASPELRNDPIIVKPAVQQNREVLQYASLEPQKDPTKFFWL